MATSIPALESAKMEVEAIIKTSRILVTATVDGEAVPL
jgi:hypothetical protein